MSADGHDKSTTSESQAQQFLPLISSSLPTNGTLSNPKSVECQQYGNLSNLETDQVPTKSSMVDCGVQVGRPHFVRQIRAFREVKRQYKQVVSAQIDARQKRRAAGFQRHDAWVCDATFMKELQKLMAEGKLKGFEGLFKLAEECQIVRNCLGPLEQEGMEAERRWEGEIWKLEKAQESLDDKLDVDLFPDDMDSLGTLSASSSSYQSDSEEDDEAMSEDLDHGHMERPYRPLYSAASISSFVFTHPDSTIPMEMDTNVQQDSILLGVDYRCIPGEDGNAGDSDSGYGDIDLQLDGGMRESLIGPFQPLPGDSYTSVDRYPELITEFETTRERINKWLLNTTLLSRLEADVIRQLLDAGEQPTPLNWPQLVIAYWALDEAAIPKNPRTKRLQNSKEIDQKIICESGGTIQRRNEKLKID